jgi:hypothetical protein
VEKLGLFTSTVEDFNHNYYDRGRKAGLIRRIKRI